MTNVRQNPDHVALDHDGAQYAQRHNGQHVIFDPFSRKPASCRRPHSLGLGLYIVKQITDAHRGSLELESTAKSGTTFTERLPRKTR